MTEEQKKEFDKIWAELENSMALINAEQQLIKGLESLSKRNIGMMLDEMASKKLARYLERNEPKT